jgi:hypothetical protein
MTANDVTQRKGKDYPRNGEQCCKTRAEGWYVVTVSRVERGVIPKKKFKNGSSRLGVINIFGRSQQKTIWKVWRQVTFSEGVLQKDID